MVLLPEYQKFLQVELANLVNDLEHVVKKEVKIEGFIE